MAETAAENGRRCIASGESEPRAGLIRLVPAPDGALVPDLAESLPGRGLWISADRALIERARRKGVFRKAASVDVAEDLADRLERQLAQSLVSLIGLARRARQAECGYDRVAEALRGGRAALVLEARDAGSDTLRIARLASDRPLHRVLERAELGLAFGRDYVVHAAVQSGGLAGRIDREAKRLAGFRALPADLDAVQG